MTKNVWMMGVIALALVACGDGEAEVVDSGRPDSGGAVDAGGDTDAGGEVDAGGDVYAGGDTDAGSAGFMALTPCLTEGLYVDGDAVAITGFMYNPACLRVTAGTTVSMPATATHPLSRSTMSGSPSNPIPMSVMTATDVTFPTPGFYPYRCTVHGTDSAAGTAGMAGVIQVVAE